MAETVRPNTTRVNDDQKRRDKESHGHDAPRVDRLVFVDISNPTQMKSKKLRQNVRSKAALAGYAKMKDTDATTTTKKRKRRPIKCYESTTDEPNKTSNPLGNGQESASARDDIQTDQITLRASSTTKALVVQKFDQLPNKEARLQDGRATQRCQLLNVADSLYMAQVKRGIVSLWGPFDRLHPLTSVYYDLYVHAQLTLITDECARSYIPVATATLYASYSSIAIAACDLDVQNDLLEDSPRTATLKLQVVRLLSYNFGGGQEMDDAALLTLLHLLYLDGSSGNEDVIRAHMNAIAHLVNRRGGLKSLTIEACLPSAVTAKVFQLSIAFERPPQPVFADYVAISITKTSLTHEEAPLENPLYSPSAEFPIAAASSSCSATLLGILHDMHSLLNQYLDHGSAAWGVTDNDDDSHCSAFSAAFAKVILNRISNYRSCHTSSSYKQPPDYIYESCRLVALVIASAIAYSLPLSLSARHVAALYGLPPIAQLIASDLRFTDTSTLWDGELTGLLFWVCLTGVAVARRPTIERDGEEGVLRYWWEDDLARKKLLSLSHRLEVLHGFDYPEVTLGTMRRMVRLQELLEHDHQRTMDLVGLSVGDNNNAVGELWSTGWASLNGAGLELGDADYSKFGSIEDV